MKTKQILILVIVSLSFLSCNKNTNSEISGSYVSDSYFKKDEGYDWVKVDISSSEKNGIVVAIRSRTDKKKPDLYFRWDLRIHQRRPISMRNRAR
jgi:hypothetical protein